MALYAIGDVHGCARTLDALLDRLALTPADTVVFVGDYVDRGPDSPGVLDRMLALEAFAADGTGARMVFLRGNHDQMMLDYVDGTGDLELWWLNGGQSTLDAYDAAGEPHIPASHIDFLRRTGLTHVQDGFAFVHAGMDPQKTVAENLEAADPAVLLWTRRHLDASLDRWEMPVVCGHTPLPTPINEPQLIGVDTGAVFLHRPDLGRLTAVQLPERRFISVPNAEPTPD